MDYFFYFFQGPGWLIDVHNPFAFQYLHQQRMNIVRNQNPKRICHSAVVYEKSHPKAALYSIGNDTKLDQYLLAVFC